MLRLTKGQCFLEIFGNPRWGYLDLTFRWEFAPPLIPPGQPVFWGTDWQKKKNPKKHFFSPVFFLFFFWFTGAKIFKKPPAQTRGGGAVERGGRGKEGTGGDGLWLAGQRENVFFQAGAFRGTRAIQGHAGFEFFFFFSTGRAIQGEPVFGPVFIGRGGPPWTPTQKG